MVVLACAACGGIAAPTEHANDGAPSPAAAEPHAPAWLVALAAHEAAGNCDAHPAAASYVRTTRQAAEDAASGDRVDSDQPVYLVTLGGQFVDYYAHGLYRTRADFPRGSVITFTVGDDHGVLDFGIGDAAVHLERLGAAHDLLPDLGAAAEQPSPPACSG